MNLLIPVIILLPLLAGIAMLLAGSRGRGPVMFGVLVAITTGLLSAQLCYDTYRAMGTDNPVVATVSPVLQFAPEFLQLRLPLSVQGEPLRWQLALGADGVGALMVLLTGIAFAATILFACNQIQHRCQQYIALLLITESLLLGVFLAMDLVTFYVCFEVVLLPLMWLISGWGNPQQAPAAARKFLLFTLAGSLPMVLGLLGIALQSGGTSVEFSTLSALSREVQETALRSGPEAVSELVQSQSWIVWLLLLGFGIKLAILPLHTWLPSTYAAAHPNTTAVIASVVAKLGVFGLLRIVLPLTPIGLTATGQMLFAALGATAIVYGALVALSQSSLRKVFAYSSISHMGFVTLGLMSLNVDGIAGATLQMFNHGIITCAMFLILGAMEQRCPTLSFKLENLGMAAVFPRISVLLIFFTFAGSGLPGLNGFVGEFLTLMGMIQVHLVITAVAVLGTVLGAWYGLRVIQRLMFGSNGQDVGKPGQSTAATVLTTDLRSAELSALAFLALICLYIGVRPAGPMKLIDGDVQRIALVTEPASRIVHSSIGILPQTLSKSLKEIE